MATVQVDHAGSKTTQDGVQSAAVNSLVDGNRKVMAELVTQVHRITNEAKKTQSGEHDLFHRKAIQIELALEALKNSTSLDVREVSRVTQEANLLAKETREYSIASSNPWRIAAGRAREGGDSLRFHDVITMRVPKNHAFEVQHQGGDGMTVHRVRQGQISEQDLGASQLWRSPDPTDSRFDVVTIGTKNERLVRSRCQTEKRGAFQGEIVVRDLCTGECQSIQVNNGRNNVFVHPESAPLSVNVNLDTKGADVLNSVVEQVTPAPDGSDSKATVRPLPQERIEVSPGDDFEGAGFRTFAEYREAMSRQCQLPPQHSVALAGKGLAVTLQNSEMLTLSQTSLGTTTIFLPAHYSDTELNSPDGVSIGVGTARIRRDTQSKTDNVYIIEPGGRHNSEPYNVSISRLGVVTGGNLVADSIIYLGEDSRAGVVRPVQETTREQTERELPPIQNRTASLLPPEGAAVTRSKGVRIQLNDAQLEHLMVYHDGSNIGVVSSIAKESEFRFGYSDPLVLRRDVSPTAQPNTFMLFAGEKTPEGRYDLWIRPFAGGDSIRSSIRVYADGKEPHNPSTDPATEGSLQLEVPPALTRSSAYEYDGKNSSPEVQAKEAPLRRRGYEEEIEDEEIAGVAPLSDKGAVSSEGLDTQRSRSPGAAVVPTVITVAKGETVSIEYEAMSETGKTLRKLADPYRFRGDTISASVPAVGEITRRKLPDGREEITITPDANFRGRFTAQPASSDKPMRVVDSYPSLLTAA